MAYPPESMVENNFWGHTRFGPSKSRLQEIWKP